MTVRELSKEQLEELKGNYLCEMRAQEGAPVSYSEIADIDNLVTDEEVFAEYKGTDFCDDDFFCTAH